MSKSHRHIWITAVWAMFALVLIASDSAHAQFYFGKNKVQYATFDWQVMTTEHFRIYFYKEEAEIAKVAARIAEDAYAPLSARFNHDFRRRVPLIVYSAPRYFAQTNVIPGLLPESVGGFTEFLKGRVVVPFHGSYFDFKHVIVHELVHVFMISKLGHEMDKLGRMRRVYPPLWFTEGIAEYWSENWDIEADMIIKDMVIQGRLPRIEDFWQYQGSYFMYKLGQSVCRFINDRYGEDKLTYIFDNWTRGRDFEETMELALGVKVEVLSREWQYSLQKAYFPEFKDYGLPSMESRRLSYDGYCLKGVPIHWDNGQGETEWIVYMAHRLGYAGIYLKPRRANHDGMVTLIKGERSTKFESLYLLRSGIDATDSGLVVFSSKSKGRDVIYIYDLNRMKTTRSFPVEELVAVRSPQFSPDQKRIVFAGIRPSGYSDLFELTLSTGEIVSLTEDEYNDIDPAYTPDGLRVVFASDRSELGIEGGTNLYEMSLDGTRSMRQLTWGNFLDQTPTVTDRGIFFSSDREGLYNLFLLDNSGAVTRQSTCVTGAFDPRLSHDGKHLVYSGYQELGFNVYQMTLPPAPKPVETFAAEDQTAAWNAPKIDAATAKATIKYDTEYSFDIAQSSIAYDPIYGSAGGIQVSLSDMLGDHAYYALLSNTADNKDDFLSSFNFGLTYVNKKRRVNWGIGAFHLYDEYYNEHDQYYDLRQAGVISFISYPVSKFNRIELTGYARYEKRDRRYGLDDVEAFLGTTFVSWVYDNSLWDVSGPLEGRRYNFSIGYTHSLSAGKDYNSIMWADVRHYFRLGSYSAFANRLYAYHSGGPEPQRQYFGGSWSFRGYDRREFYNRNILFASNELRFPLIDALSIGFPIGGLDFRGIRGALFFDAGSAWDDEFDQFLGSFGFGFRVSLGYLVLLRFDFARTTDFDKVSPSFDFDFFFGWNF